MGSSIGYGNAYQILDSKKGSWMSKLQSYSFLVTKCFHLLERPWWERKAVTELDTSNLWKQIDVECSNW